MKTILSAVLIFACAATGLAQPEDAHAIKEFAMKFGKAFNDKDAKAVSELWADDGEFVTYTGALLNGRAEIEEYFQKIFVQFYKNATNRLAEPRIRFIKPDVAAVDVGWEMSEATTSDGKARPKFSGVMVWTMTKKNGQWSIAVMHNLTLP